MQFAIFRLRRKIIADFPQRAIHKTVVSNTEKKIMRNIYLLIICFLILSCKSDNKNDLKDNYVGRTGKVSFKVANKIVEDSIVEYLNINGEEYANQIWLVNKEKDTIGGNFYQTIINDTTPLGEVTRLRFYLREPTISYESDMYILLPFDDAKLKEDYSNFFEIKLDTFPSLINDGIPHPELSELDFPFHHISEFGLDYETSGKKRIRGAVVERGKLNEKGYERRLFFEEYLYIVE
ncbi:hypothetical protein [Winogradskyella ouciana]|uniref:hypothetical protein n=1 Tax=Winogradskyella ouciana TaxID=2608631 RepID=UPI003D2CA775